MDVSTAITILSTACGAGFALLLGLIIKLFFAIGDLKVALKDKVSYDWLEQNLINKVDSIVDKLNDLKLEIASLKKD